MKTIRSIALLLLVFSFGLGQSALAASVNIANGNLYDEASISPLAKLPVTIAYNSKSGRESVFGYGWQASFDIRLLLNNNGSCVLVDTDGREELFTPNGDGTFSSAADVYDSLKKLGDTYRLNRKSGGHVGFDTKGVALEIADKNNNILSLIYNADKLLMLTGPNGEELAFATDSAGRITFLSAAGKTTSLTYDSNNNLTSITDPAGQTTSYSYDNSHNRIAKTNPAGETSSYTYDDQDRVVATVNSAGETRSIEYVSATVTRFIDPAGNATEYTIDDKQNITQKKDTAGNITSNIWDDAGNKTSVTDASGTMNMTYDGKGNMLSRTDQMGQVSSYTYNQQGQVTNLTNPEGLVTAFAYDASGNLIAMADALGNTTRYTYDGQGHIVTTTDALGRTTRFGYDSQGNIASFTDPAGSVTTLAHDAGGNMIAMTDAFGNTTTFSYDVLNRMLAMTDPKGQTTSFQYDALGKRVAVTDANGNQTRYQYDHNQRVTAIIDALSQVTGIAYLAGSKTMPQSITDAKGQVTSFSYDSLGRLVQETDPLGRKIIYQYDAKGNLIARTDSKGNTITYSYDALGRLTYAGNEHIGYAMTYDVLGRLITITDSNKRIIAYGYDKLGNRTRMIMPDGEKVAYTYDNVGRLAKIDSFLGAFAFSYDSLGRRTGLDFSNGVATGYSYDSVGLLTEIITKGGRRGEILSSLSYSHDAVGNRLSKSMTGGQGFGFGPRGHNNAERLDYTYDAVYQLIEAQAVREGRRREKEIRHRSEEYTYDAVGNRVTGPLWNDMYTHNAANQLFTSKRYLYSYDTNGNLIAKQNDHGRERDNWTYEYDYENRLIKAIRAEWDGIKTVSFKYDPFGRRIEKKVEEVEGGRLESKTYAYVYDNEDIILEIKSGKDEDGDNDGGRKAGLLKHWQKRVAKPAISRFVHGPGIDEPLAVEQKGRTFFYHADGLGSIVSLTDAKGHVIQSYEYDSFGNMQHHGGEVKQPYSYTGREWDKELGLYYYRARYYDPVIGRFISKDPIGFAGGDVNLYRYVGNGPVLRTDPTGKIDPLVGGAIALSLANIFHVGDMISDANGNVWGSLSEFQDYECTLPLPLSTIANQCVLNRCIRHDVCYEENKCNASSWAATILGGTKSCDQCNRGFFNE